jgi:hypothetical protein
VSPAIEKKPDNKSLAERFKAKKQPATSGDVCLILDRSASMNAECEPGLQRIEALRKIVKDLPGNPLKIAFSYTAQIVDGIPSPAGGTNLAPALILAKSNGYRKAIIITDGEVGDQSPSIREVQGMSIEIMYVGPDPKPSFLDLLAEAAGGKCSIEDLKKTAELTEKITNLLGPVTETKSGAIEL